MATTIRELTGHGLSKEIALERLFDDESKTLTNIDHRILSTAWRVEMSYSGKRGLIKGQGTSADIAVQNALSHINDGNPENIRSCHYVVKREYSLSQQAAAQVPTRRRPTSGGTTGNEYAPRAPVI